MSKGVKSIPSQEETNLILQRYDAAQAHNLVYTYEELNQLNIQPEFLLALLEVFEDLQAFRKSNFDNFQLVVIIDYLRKTHGYYLDKKLPEIEQSIHLLMNAYPSAHPLLVLLNQFYGDYKNHLSGHIEIEERDLFPYIASLEQPETHKGESKVTVQQFMDQHHDTEKDLEEIRTTILHYSPPADNQTLYRILLSQLEILEKDLAIHALMEDEVLLPRALQLEQKNGIS